MGPENSKSLDWITVAIAVDENSHISQTHFGDAAQILIARVKAGAHESLDMFPNPLKGAEEGHGGLQKLEKAKAFLEDIQILATGKASINFKRLRAKSGKWPVVSPLDPEALLDWLSLHLEELQRWFADAEHGVFTVPAQ